MTKRILDIGCGEGEVLIELARCYNAHVTGVDSNEDAIERCRAKCAEARLESTFIAEPFTSSRFSPHSFDLLVNIGAPPGLKGLSDQIAPLLGPGGRVLIGEGYWQQPPCAEYLTFLGADENEMQSHEANMQAIRGAGFTLERALPTSQTAWDRYEDQYYANMCAHLHAHPDDPDFDALQKRCRNWRQMYLKHGRDTLGFALYQAQLVAHLQREASAAAGPEPPIDVPLHV